MPDAGESQPVDEQRLECAECGRESSSDAAGWRAYLDDDGRAVMFCSECAARIQLGIVELAVVLELSLQGPNVPLPGDLV